jgi:hypothetical protein
MNVVTGLHEGTLVLFAFASSVMEDEAALSFERYSVQGAILKEERPDSH